MEAVYRFTTNTTAWRLLGVSSAGVVTGYATVAALHAAGDFAIPHLPQGVQATSADLKAVTSALADGSPFEFALDREDPDFGDLANDAARSAISRVCSGSGQTWSFPSESPINHSYINSIWVRKTVGTDLVIVGFRF